MRASTMDFTTLIPLLNILSHSNPLSITTFGAMVVVIVTLWLRLRKANMEESTNSAEVESLRFDNFTKQVDFLSKQLQETREENEELRAQIKQLYEQNLNISNKLSYVQSLLDRAALVVIPPIDDAH